MQVTYRQVKAAILKNFSDISFEKNQYGMFIYFENGEQVKITILSGRKQNHNDIGIHIHSLEDKSQLEYHVIDAIETASKDCFANIYIHNPLTQEEQAEEDRIQGMRLRIKAERDAQYEALNVLVASVLPGDVVRVGPQDFILVITKDSLEHSFYYTPCNFDGSLTTKQWEQSSANYINNSVMLSRVALKAEIVNCVELKSQTKIFKGQEYTWYLTGDTVIDSYMSQLDARFDLFSQACKPEDMDWYNRNESRNYHSENGDFVATFCNSLK